MTAETVSLRITLRYKDFDEFSDRFSENISSAGLFLRTRSPKPTGTKIRFELLLASGDRILRGEGAVVSVRHDDRPGMALRFAALDQQSQDVVDRVVAQHGEGELAPTPLSTPFRRGSSVGSTGIGKGFGGGFGFGGSAAGFGSTGGVLPRAPSSWAGRASEPPKSHSQPVPATPGRRGSTARPWEGVDLADAQTTQRIDLDNPDHTATQRISVSPSPQSLEPAYDTLVHEERTELSASSLAALEPRTEALAASALPPVSEPDAPASEPPELAPELLLTSPEGVALQRTELSVPEAAQAPEAAADEEAVALESSGGEEEAPDTRVSATSSPEAVTTELAISPSRDEAEAEPAKIAMPESPAHEIVAEQVPSSEGAGLAAAAEPPSAPATGASEEPPAEDAPSSEPEPEVAAAETVAAETPAPAESEAPPEEAAFVAPADESEIPAEEPAQIAEPAQVAEPAQIAEPAEIAEPAPRAEEDVPPPPASVSSMPAATSDLRPTGALVAASGMLSPSNPPSSPPPEPSSEADVGFGTEEGRGPSAPASAESEESRPAWHGGPTPRPSWTADLRMSDPPSPAPAASASAATADLGRRASSPASDSGLDEPPLVVPVSSERLAAQPPGTDSGDVLPAAIPFERSSEPPVAEPDWAVDASPLAEEERDPPAPLEMEPPAITKRSSKPNFPPAWMSATPAVEYRALTKDKGEPPKPAARESSTPRQSVPAFKAPTPEVASDESPPVDFSERSDRTAPEAPKHEEAPQDLGPTPSPSELEATMPPPSSSEPVEQDIEDFLGSFAPGEFSSPERTSPESSRTEEPASGSWASEIQSDELAAQELTQVERERPRTPPPRQGSGLVRSEPNRPVSERGAPAVPSTLPPSVNSTPAPATTPPVGAKALELIQAFVVEEVPSESAPADEPTEVLKLDRRPAASVVRSQEREVSVRGVGAPDGGRTPSALDWGTPQPNRAVSSTGRKPAVEKEPTRAGREYTIASGPDQAPPDLAPIVPRRTSVPPATGQWTEEPQRPELRGKPIVGLDLGGRWARLGMVTDGRFEPLKLGGDERFFALVGLREDGSVAVGAEARQLAAHQPERVFSPRRILGLLAGEVPTSDDLPKIIATPGSVQLELHGHTLDLAHVLANLFEPLRSRIEAAVGANAARVIISIPFEADERARQVLRSACKKAHLELVRLVTDPAAVLFATDFDSKPVDSLLFVDLDAHDLTVSVARRNRSGFGVSLGVFEPALSAVQLNEAIMRFVITELEKQGEDLRDDRVVRARLLDAIEKALETGQKEQNLELKVVLPETGDIQTERAIQIPAQRLVEVTERWVAEIMTKVNQLLADAGIHPRALGAVVLAGAASRYPALQRELIAQTQIRPQEEATGPHLRVRGLASMAQRMLSEERTERPERLSKPIGLGLPGGRYRPLVSPSDALPVRQVRKQATTRDFQAEVELLFYQGTAEQVGGNTFLGSVALTGLPKEARGEVSVEVEITVDQDAVLSVTLSEATSGRRARLTVPTEDTPHPRALEVKAQPTVVDLSDPTKARAEKKGLIGRFFGR